jgi:hypothetical protein
MKKQIILTVSESKRLIAKAVKELPQVKKAMKKGIVSVPTGTTNAMVLQELLDETFDLRRYRRGITTPKKPERHPEQQLEPMKDIVFVNGKPDPSLNRYNCVEKMGPGDIYIKGANALDYVNYTVGILIGDPKGGTIGGVLGHLIGKKIELIIPVGLEKLVYSDINDLHLLVSETDSKGPSLWPLTGTIITEIEALNVLAGVDSVLLASGGIAGAEGAVRLLVFGDEKTVENTLGLIESIKGEPPYLL